MLGLMLVLTVSSAYKRTFALGDSLSLGGNLIAAGVDWRRWLPCPSHLESDEKLRLINIQRLVELDCSRGVKYWKSMCTHTVCNISCFHIILAWCWHRLCCLVEFTSWYLCWTHSELWLLACPGLFSFTGFQTNTCILFCMQTYTGAAWLSCFPSLASKTMCLHAKKPLFGSAGVTWCGICRRETDRLLSDMRWLWCVVCI